jgi:UPF0716 family protein affecting phage T7 exclusion
MIIGALYALIGGIIGSVIFVYFIHPIIQKSLIKRLDKMYQEQKEHQRKFVEELNKK